MQFEVPQFIEIEDKIFGPLTWRQFLYIGGGIGGIIVLYVLLPFIFAVLIGLPIAALSFALAFYPINNRPFSFFVEAIYNYFLNTRLYLWRREKDVVYKSKFTPNTPQGSAPPPIANRNMSSRNVTSLARRLELEAMKKQYPPQQ